MACNIWPELLLSCLRATTGGHRTELSLGLRFPGSLRWAFRNGLLSWEGVRLCLGRHRLFKMHNGNIAYKGFAICMVLFCTYMQWSPVVDLDYVCLNGREHYVGAANPHQMGKMVVPVLLRPVRAHLEDFASHLLALPVRQSTVWLIPAPALRL